MNLTPRQRTKIYVVSMYAVAAILVLLVVFLADWEKIGRNFFNTEIMAEMFPDVILIAAKNTLIYTALSFAAGLILALFLALMRLSSIAPFRAFAIVYIELFRGLPALITLIFVGFGIPIAFGWSIPGGTLGSGSLGLAVVAGAYMAETIRAGIEAVPKGQMEAARSIGMSKSRTMFTIILPQAFRIIIPPLTNELVLLIKDTSLFFVLGSTPGTKELTKFARDFLASTKNATPLTVAAIVYLIITLPLTFMVRRLEKTAARAR
ncbi:MAG: polar amino acid transport system permease protein [Verrucomicrobiales bacterium]|jgi:polar amino acid transport system permease protein